jgi:hypothetical protein
MKVVAYLVFMLLLMPGLLYIVGYLVNKYTMKMPGRRDMRPENKPRKMPTPVPKQS